jgi:hypothetical protein
MLLPPENSYDVRDLPPDLAAAWRKHYQRIFSTMFRRGGAHGYLEDAYEFYPDLFDGLEWVPRALVCLKEAFNRRVESETEAMKAAEERRRKRNSKRVETAHRQS